MKMKNTKKYKFLWLMKWSKFEILLKKQSCHHLDWICYEKNQFLKWNILATIFWHGFANSDKPESSKGRAWITPGIRMIL